MSNDDDKLLTAAQTSYMLRPSAAQLVAMIRMYGFPAPTLGDPDRPQNLFWSQHDVYEWYRVHARTVFGSPV